MSDELRFPPEQEEKISGFLQKVKFRKRIFGGVSEKEICSQAVLASMPLKWTLRLSAPKYDRSIGTQ